MKPEIKRLLLTNCVLGALVSLAALLYISQIQPTPPAELEMVRANFMHKLRGAGLLAGLLISAFLVWVVLVGRKRNPAERAAYWASPEGKEHGRVLVLKFLNAVFSAILVVAGVAYLDWFVYLNWLITALVLVLILGLLGHFVGTDTERP